MDVIGLYAAVCARDMAAAEGWWSRLLGRGPDDRPMDGLIQWRGYGQAGIQIFQDDALAGKGRTTLVVRDMAAERARLETVGIRLEPDIRGDFGVIAQAADPDGNQVTLAEPPKTES